MATFKVLPEEATREMIEGTYMLISTMKQGTPARDREIVREIWRQAVKLAPPPRQGGALTGRMKRCFEVLCEYIDEHDGISPTYKEMAVALGMNQGDVHDIIGQLEKRGLVERFYNYPRGIRVLRRP